MMRDDLSGDFAAVKSFIDLSFLMQNSSFKIQISSFLPSVPSVASSRIVAPGRPKIIFQSKNLHFPSKNLHLCIEKCTQIRVLNNVSKNKIALAAAHEYAPHFRVWKFLCGKSVTGPEVRCKIQHLAYQSNLFSRKSKKFNTNPAHFNRNQDFYQQKTSRHALSEENLPPRAQSLVRRRPPRTLFHISASFLMQNS